MSEAAYIAPSNLTGSTVSLSPEVTEGDVNSIFQGDSAENVFQKLLDHPGNDYLPELTVSIYGGVQAFEHTYTPVGQSFQDRILALDPKTIMDSKEREIFQSLQERMQPDAEEPPINMQMLAVRFIPGLIRKYGPGQTSDLILHNLKTSKVSRFPRQGMAAVYTDVLSTVNGLVASETAETDTFQRLHLATSAELSAKEFIDQATHKSKPLEGLEELQAQTRQLQEVREDILISKFGMNNEVLQVLQNAIPAHMVRKMFATESNLREKQVLIEGVLAGKNLRRLATDLTDSLPHLLKALEKESYKGIDTDIEALDLAAGSLLIKNYTQAYKPTTDTYQMTAYLKHNISLIKDTNAIFADPQIGSKYRAYLERTGNTSAKQQARAFQLFKAAHVLGSIKLPAEVNDLDELETQLADDFVRRLTDGKEHLAPQQVKRLVEGFGTLEPLLMYGSDHMGSFGYAEVLAGLTVSVADGTYAQWRRGDGSEQSLKQMIAEEYLPENLTLQQYQSWISDDISDSHEALIGSAEETAEIIKTTVENASADVAGLASGYAFKLENLPIVINEKNSLGQLVSVLHRAAGRNQSSLTQEALNALEDDLGEVARSGEVAKMIGLLREGSGVLEVATQIKERRDQLQQLELLIRIANIDAEEIAANALLKEPAEDGTRKVQVKLQDALGSLVDDLPADLQFIPESVIELLESHSHENVHQELLSVEDSIDPRVTLEIGAAPQRTCQHYETGEWNEGLIGYFGPDVKLLIVRNLKGGIIGRSVLRLMQDASGNPVLYTEPIYQSVASPQISKLLHEHAGRKADAMGVELHGIRRSGRVDGFKELYVRRLKMPATYSDTTAAGVNRGSLHITESIIA